MNYYIDDNHFSIQELRERIEGADLIPSREILKEDIEIKFTGLENYGITTLAALRKQLHTEKKLSDLAEISGLEKEYLMLLRREIESYFPKIYSTDDFYWLPDNERSKLKSAGFDNTKKIFDFLNQAENPEKELAGLGINNSLLKEIFSLSDLTRLQWTSPAMARILFWAGYNSTGKVATADPEELNSAIERINGEHSYFKGKIGLRDVKRLIYSAKFLG